MANPYESFEWNLGMSYLDQTIAELKKAVAAVRFSRELNMLIEAGYMGNESPSGGGYWVGPAIDSNYVPYTRRDRINMGLNSLNNPGTGPRMSLARHLMSKSIDLAVAEPEKKQA